VQYSLAHINDAADLEPGQHQWKSLPDIRTDAFYNCFAKTHVSYLDAVEERDKLTNAENRLNVDSLNHLSSLLLGYEVSTAQWKQGDRSDIEKLMQQIDEGDITLHVNKHTGRLMAATSPAILNVYHIDYDDTMRPIYELQETQRTFYDSNGRLASVAKGPRSRNSMGEARHIRPDVLETPYQAAVRGLDEELNVQSFSWLRSIATVVQPARSHDTYKGLPTEYRLDYFVAELGEKAYQPIYKEIKLDANDVRLRESVFTWQRVADVLSARESRAS